MKPLFHQAVADAVLSIDRMTISDAIGEKKGRSVKGGPV
jgi:hypothetical protein